MFEAAADGAIKALWIVCTNPAQSMPDQASVRRALQRCEFVVLQDAYAHTATAAYADLLLPATTWGEKDGTVTNSERRISRVRAAVSAPGEARHDWRIGVAVARRMESLLPSRRDAGSGTLFPYDDAESVWNEHRELTRGRDLDITGLSYAALEQPQQWPYAQGWNAGRERLYGDGRFATDDRRARFVAPAWKATAEVRDARYPVSLTTGRHRDQWHGMSRTGTLGRLFAHRSEPALELHPQELARRHWRAGTLVRIESRRGQLVLPVQPSESVPPAQAFIAMHWGSEHVAGDGVNALTSSACCPTSNQPELKHAAVRLATADLPYAVVAAAWLPVDQALVLREQLRGLFAAFDFASAVPFGREPEPRIGLLFRAARSMPIDAALLARIEALLALADGPVLRYADVRAGQHRALRLADDGSLEAFVLAGNTAAQHWVLALLQQRGSAAAFGRALLAASSQPPQPVAPRSAQVCACHDVSEQRIVSALAGIDGDAGARLRELQQQLRCGTDCGSCLPAVRMLVQRHPQPVPA